MKPTFWILWILLLIPVTLRAQFNCQVFPEDSPCRKACEDYMKGFDYFQGSSKSQSYFDSAIRICPSFAEAYKEKSIAYLRTGQFAKWKTLIDKAVELDSQAMRSRGWCLFKFIKDYEGALSDLLKLSELNRGFPGQSEDGDYDLRIVIALCYRQMGKEDLALEILNKVILEHEGKNSIGVFDYLHRGVLRLKMKNAEGALDDFQKQIEVKDNLADYHYYLGLANQHLGNTTVAHLNFKEAKDLYEKEFHRWDPYCEEMDLVYYEDILKGIEETK